MDGLFTNKQEELQSNWNDAHMFLFLHFDFIKEKNTSIYFVCFWHKPHLNITKYYCTLVSCIIVIEKPVLQKWQVIFLFSASPCIVSSWTVISNASWLACWQSVIESNLGTLWLKSRHFKFVAKKPKTINVLLPYLQYQQLSHFKCWR